MKKKQYERFYKVEHSRAPTINFWLKLIKAWRYGFQLKFGIVKHRHRRSIASRHEVRLFGKHLRPIWTVYTRPAKPIGRKKHGKWLYMPKRIVVFEER